MTAHRHVLLNRPHMQHLLDLPAIEKMGLPELAALEAFMAFCAGSAVGNPTSIDLIAFADLHGKKPEDLAALKTALATLGVEESILSDADSAAEALKNRALFRHVPSKVPKARRYSVPLEELPSDWKRTIQQLRRRGKFSDAVLDRMSLRLCMFVWSARQRCLPADLGCTDALCAFYDDLRERSSSRHEGEPRFAYLRSSFEEFRRFAKAHGMDLQIVEELKNTYQTLVDNETQQWPLKFAKLNQIGSASGVLQRAMQMLDEANTKSQLKERHAGRNAAAALALGIAIPARSGDVHRFHRFGTGIEFLPAKGTYRFHYVPQKTEDTISEPLNIELLPDWNVFIDALILHEHDPRYLGELRRKAIEDKRALYINYDGSSCSERWYSRIWSKHVGTGGHIARTLVYDEMAEHGEFGIMYSKVANHHRSNRIPDKYRSKIAFQKNIHLGQAAMIRGVGTDDDISDLLR